MYATRGQPRRSLYLHLPLVTMTRSETDLETKCRTGFEFGTREKPHCWNGCRRAGSALVVPQGIQSPVGFVSFPDRDQWARQLTPQGTSTVTSVRETFKLNRINRRGHSSDSFAEDPIILRPAARFYPTVPAERREARAS